MNEKTIKNSRKYICSVAIFCMAVCNMHLVNAQEDHLDGIEEVVQHTMEKLSIPGLSLAVVQADDVLLTRGYGVRELDHRDVVNDRTLFALGSVSKGFTATAIGLLVDDGKIDWDDSLAQHIKGFRVADPYISLNLTLRDALSHRTGLDPANGLMMANTQIGRQNMLVRLAHLESVVPFRTRFVYNNLMYIAASEVIPAVSGLSWEETVQTRIFDSLNMSDSIPNSGIAKQAKNLAMPHAVGSSGVHSIPYYDMTTSAPAGGILSNAKDMSQWCRAQLNDGQLDGQQKIPAGIIPATHQPVIVASRNINQRFDQGLLFSFYGMAWSRRDYRRQILVSHEGGIDGMSAYVSMLPEQKICVVTLSNLTPSGDAHLGLNSIHNWIYDRFLGGESRDWMENLDSIMAGLGASRAAQERQTEARRVQNTTPSLALENYVGVYHHPLQGNIVVTLKDGTLKMLYGENFRATLEHWNFDTFQAQWEQPGQPPVPIQFVLDTEGNAGEIDVGDRYKRISE